ncbi:uncharacterized protein LOC105737471 [Apis florea]|uniref:uncharacterized protein LOC105737471 n=1 Tax=Apis florea TaxID=7463 RepID=UPI0012FE87A6|nr:uncharacterized protein LOC105737471 [Apis florea]
MHLMPNESDCRARNLKCKEDIAYVTKHSKWILKSIGIWPSVVKDVSRFLPKIVFGLCNFVLFFAIIPCILYIVIEENDTMIRFKLFGLLSFSLVALIKYWTLLYRKSRIKNCVEQIWIDWEQVELYEDREMMLKYGQMGRNLIIICAMFTYTGGTIFHTILQYKIGTFIDEYNRTIKPVIYPTYNGLFNVQRSPIYEFVYILHCMCGYVMHSVTAGVCGLIALFVTHACGQIDIVIARLNDLIHDKCTKEKINLNTRFINIIEHHLRILRFSATIQMILQELCFLECIGSTFLICLLEYYCITDWELNNTISLTTYIILLISLIFNIFILCYIGELLMEKSSNIGLSCFMIDWYYLPSKTIRGLILMIAISSNPTKISAGGIVDLSLSTFANTSSSLLIIDYRSTEKDAHTQHRYKEDIAYVTKHNKWILKSIGIWPIFLKNVAKFLPKIIIGISNFVLLFAIIPCILYIMFEEKNNVIKLKLCGLLIFCSIALMKHWALAYRKPKIKNCIEQIENDWEQVELYEDREMMLKYGQVGRNLTIICAVFMYTGGIIYHTILQYKIGTFIDEYNRTIKPVIYPTYSGLFNVQRSPIYELIYFLHCTCGYIMYSITAGACGLAALFATHACGQIDIIIARLNDLLHGKYAKGKFNLNARLIKIIEHHLQILRFSATVQVILQEVCFLEFIGSIFLICLLEYYCITDWELSNAISLITYTMLLISLTFNIFILCYIGERLMEKSSSIGLSCFMIDWFQLPTKTIHDLILIIAMSNNPIKISAGNIVDLSLYTFGSVLKTSLAYLSFLRTTIM